MDQDKQQLTALLRLQGYLGYADFLEGEIPCSVSSLLRTFVEICFQGRSSESMKRIRAHYMNCKTTRSIDR